MSNSSTDGLHQNEAVFKNDAQFLMNFICNQEMKPKDASCCIEGENLTLSQIVTACSLVAIIVVLFVKHRWRSKVTTTSASGQASCVDAEIPDEENPPLHVTLIKLTVILFYFYICDRSDLFMNENKHFYLIMLVFPLLYFFCLGIYHAEEVSKVLPVYMQMRVLVAFYIFLSGFGHFYYFYTKQDFSLHRFCNVLFRMNFLAVLLCFVMNRPYQFYYFVPVISFWFVLVYVTMVIWHLVSKFLSDIKRIQPLLLLFIFLILAAVITVLHQFEELFKSIFSVKVLQFLFMSDGQSMHEWRFRWDLDRYSTLFGMVFASLLIFARRYELINEEPGKPLLFNLRKESVALILLSVGGLASHINFVASCDNKPDCNSIHSYMSFLPILCFILLRNLPLSLRSYYSVFFAEVGKISLELFISQYHIWLARDTQGILILLPGYPFLNIIITSIIFVSVAHEIHGITNTIATYVVPRASDSDGPFNFKLIANATFLLFLFITLGVYDGRFT